MQEPEESKQTLPKRQMEERPTRILEEGSAPTGAASLLQDHVDRVLAGWARERPDLAVEPIAIITRLERLYAYLRTEVATVFERFGLSAPSFAVIATLRRAGKPYQLSQRALMDLLQLTGGTISVRIDRLEREGIVQRSADPHDQRGVLVRLTAKGEHLFEQVAPLHLANEERLLSALDAQQRAQLAALLRVLLLSFEPIASDDLAHPLHWLGATLAPAHLAMKIRRASGLPDVPGLLIQSVVVPGPAAAAGLAEGDLIISANGQEVRSLENLYEQFLATPDTELSLDVLRGAERRRVSVLRPDPPLNEHPV